MPVSINAASTDAKTARASEPARSMLLLFIIGLASIRRCRLTLRFRRYGPRLCWPRSLHLVEGPDDSTLVAVARRGETPICPESRRIYLSDRGPVASRCPGARARGDAADRRQTPRGL